MKMIVDHFKSSLKYKIMGLLLLVLLLSFGVLYYVISQKITQDLLDGERLKSALVTDTIRQTLDKSMVNFRADLVRRFFHDLKNPEGVVALRTIRGDAPYLKEGKGREEAFVDFKTLDDVKTRLPLRPEWVADHEDRKVNMAKGVENQAFTKAFQKIVASLPESVPEREKIEPRDIQAFYFEEVDGQKVMTYLLPLPNYQRCFLCHGSDHKLRGILMITTSLKTVDKEVEESKRRLLLISLVTLGLVGGVLLVTTDRVIVGPLSRASGRVRDISEGEGDLTKRIDVPSRDEIGSFGRHFNVFVGKLHDIVSQVILTTKEVGLSSQKVLKETKEMYEGAELQMTATDDTSHSIGEINESIHEVADRATIVTTLAQDCSSALSQISASVDGIAKSTAELSTSVEETTASIVEMSASVRQVDENISVLSSAAEETSLSMAEMDASIKQIRSHIHETVELSRHVMEDSQKGKRAVERTIDGIRRIKATSNEVSAIIHTLQKRTEVIGKILNVIDEVTEQTNLLSLNAAIIAAQAGEHGKGFAVVAQEIKELAERTANSTKEIYDIIKALQEEGRQAVSAIATGERSVEEGVSLSSEAGEALNQILGSSSLSSERISEIAKAADEQAKAVMVVSQAMARVSEMVKQAVKATHEQSVGAGMIIEATEKMREITAHVKDATQEQAKATRSITDTIIDVSRKVKEIAEACRHQTVSSAQVVESIQKIKNAAQQNVDAIGRVGFAVEELLRQAKTLEKETSRFKL